MSMLTEGEPPRKPNGHDQAPPVEVETAAEASERIARQSLMRAVASVRAAVDHAEPDAKLRTFELAAVGALNSARRQILTGNVSAALHDIAVQTDLVDSFGDDAVQRAIAAAIVRVDTLEPTLAEPVFDPWQTYIVPPFPFEILPAIVRRFVETQHRIIGCDPAALAMCALGNFSAALDHRFAIKMLRYGSWFCSPRLWVVIIGEPSDRKTPCLNATTYHLTRIEADEWRHWKRDSAAEAAPESLPEPPRLWTADTTIEACGKLLGAQDRGILIKRDELAGWIGSLDRYHSKAGSSADRAFWLQAYDGGPFTVDRISRGAVRIQNLSASILGGIQLDRLKELATLTSDGLLQRFLPVMVRRPVEPIDEPTDDVFEAYGKLTRTLLNAPPTTVIMTDDALARAAEIRSHFHRLEQASGGLAPGFRGFVGKLSGTFGSLSLILHMLDEPVNGGAFAVEIGTVERAARLIDDFILPHAFALYQNAEAGRNEGDTLRRVASFILTTGKSRVLASDLTVNVAACRGADQKRIVELVSPLVAGGWLTPEEGVPFPRAWKVNPAVHVQLSQRRYEEERRKAELAGLMKSLRRSKVQEPPH